MKKQYLPIIPCLIALALGLAKWRWPEMPPNALTAIEIGFWLTITALVGILAFIFVSRKRKQQQNKTAESYLKLGAKVKRIETSGYYDEAFGGYPEGSKQITMDVALAPSKPMALDILALIIWGGQFDAEALPEKVIKSPASYEVVFTIPKEFAIDTEDARIYVLAGGLEWYSEPFTINFGEENGR